MKYLGPLVALLALFIGGCGANTCTLAGCSDRASITVEPADPSTLSDSTTQLAVSLDGESWTITCPPRASDCEVNDMNDSPLTIVVTRGSTGVTIEIEGANPDEMPESYRVLAFVDGVDVLEDDGSFTYSTNQPNGPGCGPTCASADPIGLTLPS